MEAFVLDIAALRSAFRERTTTLPDTVVHRNIAGNPTAISCCYLCMEDWNAEESLAVDYFQVECRSTMMLSLPGSIAA